MFVHGPQPFVSPVFIASSSTSALASSSASPLTSRTVASAFVSLPGGLSDLIRALVAAIGDANVRTDTAVEAITGRGPFSVRTVKGEEIDARAVVFATPAFVTAVKAS